MQLLACGVSDGNGSWHEMGLRENETSGTHPMSAGCGIACGQSKAVDGDQEHGIGIGGSGSIVAADGDDGGRVETEMGGAADSET